jgi:hypothetical protein
LNDDGTISTNATGMKGSADSILKELSSLAESVGGVLEVEKHVGGTHVHHHESGKIHSHD